MGEPAGISGEITIKAWAGRSAGIPPFFVIDDQHRLEEVASSLGIDAPVQPISSPNEAASVFSHAVPVLSCPLPSIPLPGKPVAANAETVITSIRQAVDLVRSGEALALVTNPIHKSSLYESGFNYPGHTEFLAELAQVSTPPVMMLVCDQLRAVPVTVHLSLRDAIGSLTTDSIVSQGKIAAAALRRDFGIKEPRLAIAGLNPHAGENGAMGEEEKTVILPAIDTLREGGIDVTGPHPPDALFSPHTRETYDAAICMYHDQALIPVKALDFEGGVNVTLGLPFVRTSPDHGTAFGIAGSGQASEASLVSAIRLAASMATARAATENAA
jgi:4-hydroxythreonine-4-phosphate dehydrogenase